MKTSRPDPAPGKHEDRIPALPPGFLCPCCGFRTLAQRGVFEVCPVCRWEDDGQEDYDADVIREGPNGDLSLTEARRNYKRIGACEATMLPHVRPPYESEKRT